MMRTTDDGNGKRNTGQRSPFTGQGVTKRLEDSKLEKWKSQLTRTARTAGLTNVCKGQGAIAQALCV